METPKGFYDYSISEKCVHSNNFKEVVHKLIDFGYRTIAINQVFEEYDYETVKKKKKKGVPRDTGPSEVPVPIDTKTFKFDCEGFRILNRLTIVFGSQDTINRIMKSPNYKKYHIIACNPINQAAFQYVCGSMELDIMTFSTESRLSFKMNRKAYMQLVEKDVYFEIPYAQAIEDSTHRKNIISMSHLLHVAGRSKNVIVSSNTCSEYSIRSPYDVVNLGLIFGLNEEQSKNSISHNGRSVYLHAAGRRQGKVVMLVEDIAREPEEEVEDKISIIDLVDEDEDMEQPAQKRPKQ